MLITRETDYALRILRALSDGEMMTTGQICSQEMISVQFSYKILKKLKRNGLVQITRGAEGGCRLIADLRRVTLYDLIHVMDGERCISACMKPDFECAWREKHGTVCRVHRGLDQIQSALDTQLRACSIQSLLAEDKP